jgi:outer membrane lipoprotein-sorting protein
MFKFFLCFVYSLNVFATSSNSRDILEKIDNLYRHQQSFAKVTMNIYKPYLPGKKRSISMRVWSKGKKFTLLKIDKPIKEKGIATLRRDKNLWNFFPKIDKTIKLSSSVMMGNWMGSNFNNDDLVKESSISEDYNHSLVEQGKYYIITLTPKKDTLWSKILLTVDKELLIPISYDYFNEKLEKTRELSFSDLKKFHGNLIPSRLVMQPVDRPKEKTEIIYHKIDFKIDLKDNFFSLRNLKRKL